MPPDPKPGAPGTQQNQQGDDAPETFTREEANTLVNQAVAAHTARLEKKFAAMLGGLEQKFGALGAQPPADTAAQGQQSGAQGTPPSGQAPAAKPDPATQKLERELADLRKRYDEAETRAKQSEQKARQDATRAALRQALEAKGVKGAKARAVVSDFEASGALRYDEDGTPRLAVTRARAKGAQPAEELFDLAAGVEDWSKSDDAKDFIPAPTVPPRPAQRPGALPAVRPGAQGAQQDAAPEDPAAATVAQLARAGVDPRNLL